MDFKKLLINGYYIYFDKTVKVTLYIRFLKVYRVQACDGRIWFIGEEALYYVQREASIEEIYLYELFT